jgi:hypothetical protein
MKKGLLNDNFGFYGIFLFNGIAIICFLLSIISSCEKEYGKDCFILVTCSTTTNTAIKTAKKDATYKDFCDISEQTAMDLCRSLSYTFTRTEPDGSVTTITTVTTYNKKGK